MLHIFLNISVSAPQTKPSPGQAGFEFQHFFDME
jgi:hypothetical protein